MKILTTFIVGAAVGISATALSGSAVADELWIGTLDTTDAANVVASGNPDEASGGDGVLQSVTGIDWHENGAGWIQGLDINPNTDPPGTTDTISITFQGFGTAVSSPSPTPDLYIAPPGAATGTYEYTYLGTLDAAVTVTGAGTFNIIVIPGGSWTVYFDSSPDANPAAGTGFADGVPIITGTYTAGLATMITTGLPASASGGGTIFGAVTSVDSAYVSPDMTGTQLGTTLHLPGTAGTFARPSSIGGESTGSNTATNFVTQADMYQSFTAAPCIEIVKEVSVDGGQTWEDANAAEGDFIPTATPGAIYRLRVTNCGGVDLSNVTVTDPTLGIDVNIGTLLAGETKTFGVGDSGFENLDQPNLCVENPGGLVNTACVEGTSPAGTMVSDCDPAEVLCEEVQPEQCRVTAGGNKDGFTIPCELKSNGTPDPTTCADKGPDTWGGQAGAPPRTDGNWTHHHHPNNKDTFVFHSNDLYDITCSDPGPICEPSDAPSPDRQIDFSGIGRFTSKHGAYASLPDGDACFRVHLEDLGEPGRGGVRNDIDPTSCSHCPGTPITNDPDCEHCTDYYMIRIYDSPDYDPDTHDCTGNLVYFNGAPSYDVCNQPGDPLLDGYYVRAGNVQMHTDNNGGSVGNEEICYDGIDNDGDGLIDAADPDCYSTETSCNDGIDNDGDGLIDLADPDCQTCTPTAAKEHGKTCTDGFDNDCDGLTDAADPDCQ